MQHPVNSVATSGGTLVDTIVGAIAALSPLGSAAREVQRLAANGHARGAPCDMLYSLALLEPADGARALVAAARAGFVADDVSDMARGFLTLRVRIHLRAFDLARTMSRLSRVAKQSGAFAVLIGPAEPSLTIEHGDSGAAIRTVAAA